MRKSDKVFFGIVVWCFAWGFRKNHAFDVVFLWSICGGMRGEAGVLTVTFLALKNMPLFQLFFCERAALGAL
jgi:hypothetical protein